MALPARFEIGMARRKQQYGLAWNKIGATFPNLEIWYVDTITDHVKECTWSHCVEPATDSTSTPAKPPKQWNPREGTIGFLVKKLMLQGDSFEKISAEVMKNFPGSHFNKKHFRWYRNRK